ncbi:MAG: hypothetical protein IJV40_04585 [Oscillospiraceae bacterium]|nr:hypothetical protein [Oscillospiraceae bacterium]
MFFYDQMFNPATVNPEYYRMVQAQIAQHEWEQNREILNAMKAVHDLCSSVKKLDMDHQQQAFLACLQQMAIEMNWQRGNV